MLSISENIFKFKMLNEFENELDQIFEGFNNKLFSYNKCLDYIKDLIYAWNHLRLDLINTGSKKNMIEILEKNNVEVYYPSWFESEEGKGCTITSISNKIKLLFNSNDDGNLNIILRGMDYRNHKHERFPVFIDCEYLKINDQYVFDENTLIWHDDSYNYEMSYNKTENIELILSFKTIHDYFPLLNIFLSDIIDKNDFIVKYEKTKNYISYEKLLIRVNDIENDVHTAIINL